jgi:hypothetical protein
VLSGPDWASDAAALAVGSASAVRGVDHWPKQRLRLWARWWAAVATVVEEPPASGLATSERQQLLAGYWKLGRRETAFPKVIGGGPLCQLDAFDTPEKRDAHSFEVLDGAMREAHDTILLTIVNLEKGSPFHALPLPSVHGGMMVAVDRESNIFEGGRWHGAQPHLVALRELLRPGQRFPFRRCPICGRIFARTGRALRCSFACTRRYHEDRRAGPERNTANATAAKKYRQKKKGERKRAARTAAKKPR